jgi:predicted naringenin-chalcone synthase
MILTELVATRPRFAFEQATSLDWLARAHGGRGGAERLRHAIGRVACGPDKIAMRGHSVPGMGGETFADGIYDLDVRPRGAPTSERMAMFSEVAAAYFESTYARAQAPDDIVHVTCTGYASPSAAQRLVAAREWPTRVTHAYPLGCYAAIPALRIAQGYLALGSRRVDLVHTELCSLHMAADDHRLEQLVVQSLFADGLIRYSLVPAARRGLRVLATHEAIMPGTATSMSWTLGDHGMQMTLSRDVPERIAGALRPFVGELCARGGRDVGALRDATFAVHPGGPKILDRVEQILELAPGQLAASRGVLRDFGNMSSATLPHIWQRSVDDAAPGTLVPSLAFGPGLTMCGALLEMI